MAGRTADAAIGALDRRRNLRGAANPAGIELARVAVTTRRRRPGPSPSKMRYAVFAFGQRVTPWRARRETALRDAIAGDYATQADGEAPFFWVGASLVSEKR